jgi:hypothetical protein
MHGEVVGTPPKSPQYLPFSSVKEATQKNLSDALSALVVWRGGALCASAINTASVAFFLRHVNLL